MLYRLLPVSHVLGLMLMVFSLAYPLPMTVSMIYGDGTVEQFADAMAFALLSGVLLAMLTRRHKRELRPRDGFLLVTLAWLLMAAIATVPLLLTIDGLSFTDAYFEAMSGLTTTGATVLTGLERLPPSVNFWRLELHWLGGMGIIVLAVAVLPLLGVGGMQLYKAEATGPVKDAKLTARIADTAKALWLVYVGITAACALALGAAGMGWFDAVCHAMSTVSLGGFSTYDASVGQFDSPVVEAVMIVFMMVAGMNFASHFVAWRGRSLGGYRRDSEAKAFVALVAASVLVCTLYLVAAGTYPEFLTALRHTAFNLVSMATTAGFVSQDFEQWPVFVPLWMLFLSCIAVSSGSTGGGIKMFRTLLLARQGLVELKRLVHPNVVAPVRIGTLPVPQQIANAVLGFIFLYILAVGELTFFLVASGLDFISSVTAVVASINNAGPGLNVVGPARNFQALTDFQTWICTFAMLIGRLEVLSVFVLFTPDFWRR